MDDFVMGECPDVSMPQAVNQIDWYQSQIAELGDENRRLTAENAELRGDLDTLLNKLATANVYANRTGW
jgi:FtsZ-binding cell division protein ZapB